MEKRILQAVLLLAVLLLGAVGLYSWLHVRESQGENTLVVGYHKNFGGASAMMVGIEKGYFEQEGLDVQLVSFSSGPSSIAALEAGDVDVSFLGHGATSFLLAGKAEVIALDSLSYAEEILVRADAGINTVEQLAGRKIATPFGTSGENFLDIVLQSKGMSLADVTTVNYDVAGAITALSSGAVDAAAVWAPYTTEAKAMMGNRAQVLVDCRDMQDEVRLPMSWVASGEYIRQNPQKLEAFVRALYKSMAYRSAHLQEAVAITAQGLGMENSLLLQDVDIAEWITPDSLKKYLQNGDVERWYANMHQLFETKSGAVQNAVPVKEYLHLEFMQAATQQE